jgi:hypothetical protein
MAVNLSTWASLPLMPKVVRLPAAHNDVDNRIGWHGHLDCPPNLDQDLSLQAQPGSYQRSVPNRLTVARRRVNCALTFWAQPSAVACARRRDWLHAWAMSALSCSCCPDGDAGTIAVSDGRPELLRPALRDAATWPTLGGLHIMAS